MWRYREWSDLVEYVYIARSMVIIYAATITVICTICMNTIIPYMVLVIPYKPAGG